MTSNALSLPSRPFAAAPDLAPGVILAGKYSLVRPIGVGGMGTVWLACNEATGAEVALKVLLPHSGGCAELSARFRREAYTTARLCHRGIVRIYDLVEVEGDDASSLVLVMELLRGHTLAACLHQRGPLPLEDALAIVLPVLSALSYAHQAGIVHRDLKPENIFLAVDPDGVVTPKILDFGISKVSLPQAPIITRDGEMVGTPSYMSPEQIRGSDVDAQSDIFNVGILLYEMLSGQNPFSGEALNSMMVATLERDPAPLEGLATEVWSVIDRALCKSRSGRYQTAKELAVALRLAVGLPLTSSHAPDEPVSGTGRSHKASSPRGFVARGRLASIAPVVHDIGKTPAGWRNLGAAAVAVAIAASVSIAWGSHANARLAPSSASVNLVSLALDTPPLDVEAQSPALVAPTPEVAVVKPSRRVPSPSPSAAGATVPKPTVLFAVKTATAAPAVPRASGDARGDARGAKLPFGIARDPGF